MKIFNIIIRILAYPFILCILLIKATTDSLLILRYGGEVFLYKRDEKKKISDIYELLKEQHESKSKS